MGVLARTGSWMGMGVAVGVFVGVAVGGLVAMFVLVGARLGASATVVGGLVVVVGVGWLDSAGWVAWAWVVGVVAGVLVRVLVNKVLRKKKIATRLMRPSRMRPPFLGVRRVVRGLFPTLSKLETFLL